MNKNTGGKGSGSRPLSVPLEVFGEKHTAIFGERKRTNGGWTPPPLNNPEHSLKTNVHAHYTDKPTVAEDGMVLPEYRNMKDAPTLVTIDSLAELESEKG